MVWCRNHLKYIYKRTSIQCAMTCVQYNSSHSFLIYLHITLLAWDNAYMCLFLGVCALDCRCLWNAGAGDLGGLSHLTWVLLLTPEPSLQPLILPFYRCVSYFLSMWWLLSLYNFSYIVKIKNCKRVWSDGSAVRALSALPRDLGSVPVIHMAVRSCNCSSRVWHS